MPSPSSSTIMSFSHFLLYFNVIIRSKSNATFSKNHIVVITNALNGFQVSYPTNWFQMYPALPNVSEFIPSDVPKFWLYPHLYQNPLLPTKHANHSFIRFNYSFVQCPA
mmetsp:Transcript_23831/g.34833  ORF Transcript_23831/g.34833 Transcript_23831/m.34833 type:complete len:109 (-) Transcript_23831:182-508(-)